MAKNHIAIVCQSSGTQGSVVYVVNQYATRLIKYFEVSLISDSFSNVLSGEVNKIRISPHSFNYLKRFCHVPNEVAFCRAARAAIGRLHEIKPVNFIYTRSHSVATLALLPIKRKYGIPYGLNLPGDIFLRPPGTYDLFLTRLYKFVTPKAYAGADLICASSPYMEEVAKRYGIQADKIVSAPHGIDIEDLGISDTDAVKIKTQNVRQDGSLLVLYIGRIAREKGISQLLEAMRSLSEKGYDNIFLEIIGAGPEITAIQSYIASNQLAATVTLRGQLPRHDLGKEYAKADVLCMPSIDEAYGMVAIESMMCGTPVIASNIGGLSSLVDNDKTGILVKPNSPNEISNAILSLYLNKKRLKELSLLAKSSANNIFTWNKTIVRVAKAIQRSISSCV